MPIPCFPKPITLAPILQCIVDFQTVRNFQKCLKKDTDFHPKNLEANKNRVRRILHGFVYFKSSIIIALTLSESSCVELSSKASG